MKTDWTPRATARTWTMALLALILAGTLPARNETRNDDEPARTLYVWAGDQARVAPDFLAVIDFDEDSPRYGKVIRTVPVPGPGGSGNEPHHCNLSADKNILACGGLLALLKGQNSIFFFDVSNAAPPEIPVLDERHALEHHRRLPATEGRWIPGHADGRPRRRHARSRRRVRQEPADGRASGRRIRRCTISTLTASRRVRTST